MTLNDLAVDLLVFRSGGTRFGLDAAQIAEVLRLQELEVVGDGASGARCVCGGGVEIPVVELVSPASNGELVFLVTTYGGILTCYDAGDGKMVWEQELDTSFESSPTVVGERVYLMSTDGVMHIFAARRVYEELGRAELGEAASTCPAFQDGRIYIRGKENLYCMGGA